ncbi:DUF3784 domain-containing protein [Sporosarcina sp. P29]|uniref:DUF3784 domain-containing protein n=1 Tax=Sporosarcina sp. P29 TaxID=2048252 RepID=UPI000C165B1A|nr:DUF3784 domain-containing protein [Sporosarcina sp. P29]PIC99557.1 hypothetical protein CSV68_07345 [Sporosarcina sp. P29]
MIITLLIIGGFMGLGIIFMNGKGSILIAGYNTMSPVEKEQYDVVALCKFMGKMMFALSFSMVFWLLSDVYNNNSLFYFGLVLFIAIVAFMLIYINAGNRFYK